MLNRRVVLVRTLYLYRFSTGGGKGGKTFAEVLVGEGQKKELEKRNEGSLGKADQNLGKRVAIPEIWLPRNLFP
ncbi:hypothetical protein SLA2020_286960 [Shorea laevis]